MFGVSPQPGAKHQPGDQQKAEETTHLMIFQQRLAPAAHGGHIEGEGQAAEDHEQHGHPVNRRLGASWRVEESEVEKPPVENGRHGVVDGIKGRHARGPEGKKAQQGKQAE